MGTKFFPGENSVVALDTETLRMYLWVPNTGEWHRNRAVEIDYLVDQEDEYPESSAEVAAEKVKTALPMDERGLKWLVDEYREQPPEDRRSHADFGLVISGRHATRDRALLGRLEAGDWVPVKAYWPSQRDSAKALASDIRKGKRKGLAQVGALEAEVVESGKVLLVRARHVPAAAVATSA